VSVRTLVRTVRFGTETFRRCTAVKTTVTGENEMLGVGWLPHQPSHALDDVWTPVFDRFVVNVIPSHILESVLFPLPESLITWHASHELLDTIAIVEAWEKQSGVFFLQHVVIVRLHSILLDPPLDMFLLCTCCKQVLRIDLYVHSTATLTSAFPWLRHLIDLQRPGGWVCFRPL